VALARKAAFIEFSKRALILRPWLMSKRIDLILTDRKKANPLKAEVLACLWGEGDSHNKLVWERLKPFFLNGCTWAIIKMIHRAISSPDNLVFLPFIFNQKYWV